MTTWQASPALVLSSAPSAGRGFGPWDWTVLVAYLVGITIFGLWIARRVRTSQGYFLGDRQLPWWIMIGQSFGTGTHAENPVAQAGVTSQAGFATIWYQWKNMLITPFYWLMAPWYRRSQRTTVGEMIEDRYGRALALFYTLFAMSYFAFVQGSMLKGAGKLISVATGGQVISPNGVVAAMTVTFIVYSFFGGLMASAYTDFIQGFLIITLSFMLIPTGLLELGGFHGLHESLPQDFFDLYNQASGINAFAIAMLAVNGLLSMSAQPHALSMYATGRSERAGRVGHTYGSLVKRFCAVGWALTGLIVAAMIVRQGIQLPDKEHAFGFACLHLLGPGWVGLMVACVLAANMSACSNMMVNTGAIFTQNIYKEYIHPRPDDRRLLLVGRLSGLTLTLAGVLFALLVDQVLQAFLFTETIAALVGIMFVGGLLWRRANRQGAMAATAAAFAVYYAANYGEVGHVQLVYTWKALPFAWAVAAGTIALVAVSLLTRPENPAKIAKFFGNMARSTDGARLGEDEPRPLAAERGQDLLLLDLPGWFTAARWRGFRRRYREDLTGFALAWATVGVLILGAWGLMQIGK